MRHPAKKKAENYYAEMKARETARNIKVEEIAWNIMPAITTEIQRLEIRSLVRSIESVRSHVEYQRSQKNGKNTLIPEKTQEMFQTNLNHLLMDITHPPGETS